MSDPLDLARQLYAALDEESTEPFLALCAPDAVVDYPAARLLPYGGAWRGRDGVDAFLSAHDAAEEILAFETIEMVANGDTVFVLGRFQGRARPSSTTWETRFVHVLTFRDERLARWEAYFDTASAVEARAAAQP